MADGTKRDQIDLFAGAGGMQIDSSNMLNDEIKQGLNDEVNKIINRFSRSRWVLLQMSDQVAAWLKARGLYDSIDRSEIIKVINGLGNVYAETARAAGMPLIDGTEIPEETNTTKQQVSDMINGYMVYHEKHAGSYMEAAEAFADRYMHDNGVSQTEIPGSDEFPIMLSKPAGHQLMTAARGRMGSAIDVGGGAIVYASITDIHGDPLALSAMDKQIQDVIGGMIDRNGFLPLCVTPAQIFREWKGAQESTTVNDDDIALINEIMERLMFAPAELDYSMQIKKHTHLKQQNDFDYSDPTKAKVKGNLLTAEKRTLITKNGVTEGYMIHQYPLYYRQSHIVSQIGTLPKALLNSPRSNTKRKQGVEKRATYSGRLDTELRRYLAERLARIAHDPTPTKRIVRIEEIENDFNVKTTDKTVRTLRNHVCNILDEWKNGANNSSLSSWEWKMNGRKYDGWILNPIQRKNK